MILQSKMNPESNIYLYSYRYLRGITSDVWVNISSIPPDIRHQSLILIDENAIKGFKFFINDDFTSIKKVKQKT